MPDTRDIDLVRDYVGRHSEPAFTELVRRHVNFVYSVALRHVGDSQDAQDVTQAVFIILARKAGSLRHRMTLTGWLYETTRFTSRQFLRTKNRRQAREHEAYMRTALDDSDSETTWQQLAPLLEETMERLSEKDRTLVALRFFENKSIAETAALLGIQEWAARKRVERAMARLRDLFAQRGIAIPAAALANTLVTNSIQAAPAGLAQMAAHVALAKGAGASSSTLTLIKGALKIMAYKKAAIVAAGIAVAIIVGVSVSVPEVRTAVTNLPKKVASNLPAVQRKEVLMAQMQTMKQSVWPAMMKYSSEHQGAFPATMQELRSYLPPGLAGLDDDHWRITALSNQAKPNTPELLTFCEQINQPAGQPHIVLYADGHVEYRK